VGDFNNDGRDDIALIRQSGGWATIPIAFATVSRPKLVVHKSPM
jgi:hypothetical protein